jgi:molecular chaperone DnaK
MSDQPPTESARNTGELTQVDWAEAVFPDDVGATAPPIATPPPEKIEEEPEKKLAPIDPPKPTRTLRSLKALEDEFENSGLRLVASDASPPAGEDEGTLADTDPAFDERGDIDLWATSLSTPEPSALAPPRSLSSSLPTLMPTPLPTLMPDATDELPIADTGDIEPIVDDDLTPPPPAPESEAIPPDLADPIISEPPAHLSWPIPERDTVDTPRFPTIPPIAPVEKSAELEAGIPTQPPRPIDPLEGKDAPVRTITQPPQPIDPRAAQDTPIRTITQPPRPIDLRAAQDTPIRTITQPPQPIDARAAQDTPIRTPAQPRTHDAWHRPTTQPPPHLAKTIVIAPPTRPPPESGDIARAPSPPPTAPPPARTSTLPPEAHAKDPVPRKAPPLGPRSKAIIGIDLGTTYSCAAFVTSGRTQVLASRRGPPQIPSVVTFLPGGKTVVGEPAVRLQASNAASTIVGSKRLMGRPFSSPVVQELRSHFAYEIVAGENGEAAVKVEDRVISLEEVAAVILREIRESATLQLEERVNRAIITCPAHFNERQRDAVRTAGELAGFYVERILSEPTAAALTYGAGKDFAGKRILVYDLGGGTFDVSVLEVRGDVFEVLATGGDTFLGGLDFDACIAELLVERFLEAEEIDARTDPIAMARIFQFAEQAKRELSERPTTIVEIDHLVVQPYAARTLTLPMRRARVEDMWSPLVDHTLEIVADVCRRANLAPTSIDEVILVGGQSRSPIVARKVAQFFGKDPNRSLHPDEAIALGAAKYAAATSGDRGVTLLDALPMSIGVGLPGGRFKKLIQRDSRLPASHIHHLRTTHEDQDTLEVILFQGEDERVEFNEPLGILKMTDLPPGPKGSVTVDLTIQVTAECVLEVVAKETKSGRIVRSRLGTKDTPEALRQKLGLPAQPTHEELERRKTLTNHPKGVWGWLTRLFGGSGKKKDRH